MQATYEKWPRAAQQIWNLFILPELGRRNANSRQLDPSLIRKAQVLFPPGGGTPTVRLDDEVKASAMVLMKEGTIKKKGDPIYRSEIEAVEELKIELDDYPDWGHFTMVQLADWWMFSFDLRYRKRTVQQLLVLANQFLSCAASALRKRHLDAFVDNAYSAAEIIAKSELALLPLPVRKTHKSVKRHYGQWTRMGNARPRYLKTLNRLSNLRPAARYQPRPVQLDLEDARRIQRTVREMARALKSRLE